MLRETSTATSTIVPFPFPIEEPKPRAQFVQPAWWGDIHVDGEGYNYEGRCRQIVKAYLTGQLHGKWKGNSTGGRHVYYTKNDGAELWLFKDNPAIKVRICLAKKVGGYFIGNASSIMALRQTPSRHQKIGRLHWVGGAQKIQEVLQDVMPMIPFRMFKENRLDLDTLKVIEKAEAEMLDLGQKRKGKEILNHYTGAMLFTLKIRARSRGLVGHSDEYYLFDIDRNDLARKRMNPFLSKLGRAATSIKDAYASLKPEEVAQAERFLKREVPRQGEWFFIPSPGEHVRATQVRPSWQSQRGRPAFATAVLQSKGNRPHFVEQLSEDGMVQGKVTHGGHEHLPLQLDGWHKPVPNTAIESFRISGQVD